MAPPIVDQDPLLTQWLPNYRFISWQFDASVSVSRTE
uniref:Uncharacterized protein n=1 Tax=Anguilla anguilla TaxID=7936 RepID=A0A0E9W0P9_ANGAN